MPEIFRTLGIQDRNEPLPTTPSPVIQSPRTYKLLQFWTVAAFFSISMGRLDFLPENHSMVYNIYDCNGKVCGGFYPEDETLLSKTEKQQFLILFEINDWAPGLRPTMTRGNLLKGSDRGGDDKSGYVVDISSDQPSLFWIMLVDIESGVVGRRGLGQIVQRAMRYSCSPGPMWRETVLG